MTRSKLFHLSTASRHSQLLREKGPGVNKSAKVGGRVLVNWACALGSIRSPAESGRPPPAPPWRLHHPPQPPEEGPKKQFASQYRMERPVCSQALLSAIAAILYLFILPDKSSNRTAPSFRRNDARFHTT